MTFRQVCAFIREHHRHHGPPQGYKFGVGVADGEKLVGVVAVGRPVARHLDDGYTLEVTRCCTDGTPNAASMLYGAAWRAAKAMGALRMVTYTLPEEPGTSLKAAGWRELRMTNGGGWDRPNRSRTDHHPTGPKRVWGVGAF